MDEASDQVFWDKKLKAWCKNVRFQDNRAAQICFYQEGDSGRALTNEELVFVNAMARIVVDDEPRIRAYVVEKLFDGWKAGWYDREIDEVTSVEGFHDAISLAGVNVFEGAKSASFIYNDGNRFGGHGIVLEVDEGGKCVTDPNIFG